MKFQKLSFMMLFLAFTLTSCNTSDPKSEPKTTQDKKDSVVVKRDLTQIIANAKTSEYNNFARFIAGLPQTNTNCFSPSASDSLWIKYANQLKSKWDLMTQRRTAKLNIWAAKELPEAMRESEVLFYPFSGADILNAIIEEYKNSNIQDKNKVALNTVKFINDRLEDVKKELGDVEGDLGALQKEHPEPSPKSFTF